MLAPLLPACSMQSSTDHTRWHAVEHRAEVWAAARRCEACSNDCMQHIRSSRHAGTTAAKRTRMSGAASTAGFGQSPGLQLPAGQAGLTPAPRCAAPGLPAAGRTGVVCGRADSHGSCARPARHNKLWFTNASSQTAPAVGSGQGCAGEYHCSVQQAATGDGGSSGGGGSWGSRADGWYSLHSVHNAIHSPWKPEEPAEASRRPSSVPTARHSSGFCSPAAADRFHPICEMCGVLSSA